MARIAVIDSQTNAVLNYIVAEPTDSAYEGTKLIEIPEGYYWDGQQVSLIPAEVINGN
jgi:hypothetical protein